MPETMKLELPIRRRQVAKALALEWAWFKLYVNDGESRAVLVRPTMVTEEKVVESTSTDRLLQYVFEAVDQEGSTYRVTVERLTSYVPDVFVPTRGQAQGSRSGRYRTGSRQFISRQAESTVEFTPKPEPKPRIARA